MNRMTFINHFVATFCATWAAQHYDEYCARGQQDQLENPPIEDAECLAIAAWDKMQALADQGAVRGS